MQTALFSTTETATGEPLSTSWHGKTMRPNTRTSYTRTRYPYCLMGGVLESGKLRMRKGYCISAIWIQPKKIRCRELSETCKWGVLLSKMWNFIYSLMNTYRMIQSCTYRFVHKQLVKHCAQQLAKHNKFVL